MRQAGQMLTPLRRGPRGYGLDAHFHPRGNMSQRNEISYKWVVYGAAIIIGLQGTARLLIAGSVGSSIVASYGPTNGALMLAGIVAIIAYFIGGIVIGVYSPGETIREPAYATLLAITPNLLNNLAWHFDYNIPLAGWATGAGLTVIVAFLMAMGGAWIGEKMQGRTVEKLQERGELPPMPPKSDAGA